MFNYLNPEPESFSLDISDLSLKIAKIEKSKGKLKLVSFSDTKINPGIVEGGSIKNPKLLASIIRKSLANVKGKKIRTKYVTGSLPEEKSFLDIVKLPKMSEDQAKSAIGYEIEKHIPLPASDVYFDSQIISPADSSGPMEVLLTAVSKEVADSYIETLEFANLKPKALELECLAISRALIEKSDGSSDELFLIIDFGQTRTSFIISSGNIPRFTSTIPISSQELTESIARNLKVGLDEAEGLKIKQGLEGSKEIFNSIIPPLADLVDQIKVHLNYYYSHEFKGGSSVSKNKIDKILLSGGGANLKGLTDFLSSKLKLKVELANPWINILKEPLKEIPGLSFEKSLGYATALGLALRQF
ncbi:type IV pilus assembly protein PilM [bacterium]|nr:type IV pilus assembly protein PilM [bacterium]